MCNEHTEQTDDLSLAGQQPFDAELIFFLRSLGVTVYSLYGDDSTVRGSGGELKTNASHDCGSIDEWKTKTEGSHRNGRNQFRGALSDQN